MSRNKEAKYMGHEFGQMACRSFSLSQHTLVIKQEVQVLTHSLKTLPLSLRQIGFGRRDQLGVVELKYLLKIGDSTFHNYENTGLYTSLYFIKEKDSSQSRLPTAVGENEPALIAPKERLDAQPRPRSSLLPALVTSGKKDFLGLYCL